MDEAVPPHGLANAPEFELKRVEENVVNSRPIVETHSIRVAKPGDFEAVSRLLLASYSTLLTNHYDADLLKIALPFMTRANPDLLASGTWYVAESKAETLVGCGGWSRARPDTGETVPGEGHVRHFATHPEWLGRGIGTSLLARCFKDAQPLIHTLHCFSTLSAEPFYRACGFETIGPIEVPMGSTVKFPAMLMKRHL